MPLPRFVQAGMRMLQRGGTAADAAVAVAAALNVTEPCSTGGQQIFAWGGVTTKSRKVPSLSFASTMLVT